MNKKAAEMETEDDNEEKLKKETEKDNFNKLLDIVEQKKEERKYRPGIFMLFLIYSNFLVKVNDLS